VPASELRTYRGAFPSVATLSKRFKVSSLVVLRRLRDVGALSAEDFAKVYDEEAKRLIALAKKSSGGSYYRTQEKRLGNRFASALIESTMEGKTSYREALQLFGSKKVETFREYAIRLQFPI
jgi:Zn-dependent peptidase ImmA (M78 family)